MIADVVANDYDSFTFSLADEPVATPELRARPTGHGLPGGRCLMKVADQLIRSGGTE